MSGGPSDRTECEPFQDDLAAMALGTLTGERREEVLEHVEVCLSCSAELTQLTTVADAVLELAPEAEPPLGFESRLARRLEAPRPKRTPTPRRRLGAFALAAIVIAVVGVGVGVLIENRAGTAQQPGTSRAIESSLRADGRVVGNVILSSSPDVWMIMTVDKGWWTGAVTCEAILADGSIDTVGTFRLSGGYGTWGAKLTAPKSQVRAARLVARNGDILASATIKG